MTTLTKDIRNRAVEALRRAHAEGRKKTEGDAWDILDPEAVCSCVIIAEEFGLPVQRGGADALYTAIGRLGFSDVSRRIGPDSSYYLPIVTKFNDSYPNLGAHATTFDQVADMVAALDVVEEAEAILREAALVPA